MNISTSLNVFEIHHPIDDQIRRCKEAGFLSLDFNYWDYQQTVADMSWPEEEAWARNIRAAADAHGVRFTQMHGPVHGGSFTEMVMGLNVESFLEMASRSLRTAGILGVPWSVFHPSPLSLRGEESHREVLDTNVEFYRRLLPVMEETGVGIALENIFDRTGGDRTVSQNLLRDPRTVGRAACGAGSSAVRRMLGHGTRPPARAAPVPFDPHAGPVAEDAAYSGQQRPPRPAFAAVSWHDRLEGCDVRAARSRLPGRLHV